MDIDQACYAEIETPLREAFTAMHVPVREVYLGWEIPFELDYGILVQYEEEGTMLFGREVEDGLTHFVDYTGLREHIQKD